MEQSKCFQVSPDQNQPLQSQFQGFRKWLMVAFHPYRPPALLLPRHPPGIREGKEITSTFSGQLVAIQTLPTRASQQGQRGPLQRSENRPPSAAVTTIWVSAPEALRGPAYEPAMTATLSGSAQLFSPRHKALRGPPVSPGARRPSPSHSPPPAARDYLLVQMRSCAG